MTSINLHFVVGESGFGEYDDWIFDILSFNININTYII